MFTMRVSSFGIKTNAKKLKHHKYHFTIHNDVFIILENQIYKNKNEKILFYMQ